MEKYNKMAEKYFSDLLPNCTDSTTTKNFLNQISMLSIKYVKRSNDRSEKIINFKHPAELKKMLNLEIKAEPSSLQEILNDCEVVLNNVVKTGHPRFFNQLSQGLDVVSLAGEWLTAATNTNMFTYEIAPVYVLMEEVTLGKMREFIGWNEPGDGILNPGGSISNLYAIQAARHHFFPEIKANGLFNSPKLIIFTSEHSHYSVAKAAAILGHGLNQVKLVPVDDKGKLKPNELEKLILECLSENQIPLLVSLTAGTTVLGAFDPINPVADICEKYKIWLHVDAAWGGGALLSQKHKHLLNGIERSDSVTWNPHKIMGCHLQASAFLVKKTGILLEANEMAATYLFQQDKHYDLNYDTGDKTIQCGRHVDIYKVWLMFKAKGLNGFEKQIDRFFELAKYLYNQILKRENFEIVLHDPEFTNICFWYIPNSLKNVNKKSISYKTALHKIAPIIKEKMMQNGNLMIGYQPLDEKPNFFRMIISNSATIQEDLDFVLDEIERLGKDL